MSDNKSSFKDSHGYAPIGVNYKFAEVTEDNFELTYKRWIRVRNSDGSEIVTLSWQSSSGSITLLPGQSWETPLLEPGASLQILVIDAAGSSAVTEWID